MPTSPTKLRSWRPRLRRVRSGLPLKRILLALLIAGGLIAAVGTFAKTSAGNVDIVLTIDTSYSVSSAEYRDQINATAQAIRAIPITNLPGNLRIAVVEFAGGATTSIPMTTVKTRTDLERIAKQLTSGNKNYTTAPSGPTSNGPGNTLGGTNASAGLEVANKLFGSSTNNKSICIVSDGEFTDPGAFNKAVKNLSQDQLKRLGIASFSYNKGGAGGGNGGIKTTTEADLRKAVFGDGKAAVAKSPGAFPGAITSACLSNLQNIFPTVDETGKTKDEGKDKPRKSKPVKPYVPKTEKPAAPCSGDKDPVTGNAPDCSSVVQWIDSAYGWLAVLGGLLAVLMLIYAGYSYMASNGDPEKMSNAKDVVEKVLIGLALLILATIILNAVNGRTTKSCHPGKEGCGAIDFSKPDGGAQAPK